MTSGILTGGEPRVSLNFTSPYPSHQTSLVAQQIKNPPAVQETLVQFLGQEVPLEKEMAAHSSILAWRIPWTEEPGRLQKLVYKCSNLSQFEGL